MKFDFDIPTIKHVSKMSDPQVCYRYSDSNGLHGNRPIECLPAGVAPKTYLFSLTIVDSVSPQGADHMGTQSLCYTVPGGGSAVKCFQPGQLPPVNSFYRYAQP